VSEIRLLFASLPTMLSEILRTAANGDPDLKIVEEMPTLEGIAEAAGRTRPDVLVVGVEDGGLPRECARAMYERPRASTLAVSPDGQIASAYRLRPYGIAMENASSGEIIAAIRELSLPPPELRD
jgi:DNA-binding NarL/FixJ family response regulator